MTREDAEMFIDGILGVKRLEPVRAILPVYYKIRTISLDNNHKAENLDFVKLDAGIEARFYDYNSAKRVYTYLVEHSVYKQAIQSGMKVCLDDLPWKTMNHDWESHVKYISEEGSVSYIKVDWEAYKEVTWIIVPCYDDDF